MSRPDLKFRQARQSEGHRVSAQRTDRGNCRSDCRRIAAETRQSFEYGAAAEPEFFEDKRNLEDLWMAAFPVETEWHLLNNVDQIKWSFTNLEDAFEEGGNLFGKRVYLFGCTERDHQVDRLKSEVFTMSCTQRRAALKQAKIDCIKKYEYCLPYFKDPLKEDEDEKSTEVMVLFPAEPEPVCFKYNWARDKYEAFLKEKAEEGKKANEEEMEARRKALEEISEETRSGFENMKMYKFFPVPTPDTPDIFNVKLPYINIYYGKAHEVL